MLALDTIELILQMMIVAFVGGAAFSAVWLAYIKWLGLREWWARLAARPKQQHAEPRQAGPVRHYNALPMARGDEGAERRAVEERMAAINQQRRQRPQPKQWSPKDEAAYRAFLEEMEGDPS